MSDVAIGRDQIVFCVKETSHGGGGTIVGASAVLVIGSPSFVQERDFGEDEQKRMTVSRTERISNTFHKGVWAMESYIKPSGTAGTEPIPDVLLECNYGKKTVVEGTSVAYTLSEIDDDIPTALIVYKQGHEVFWNFGCTVDKGVYPVSAGLGSEATGRATFSGEILRQLKAGVSTVNNGAGYSSTDTSIVVDDAREFEAGTRIEFQKADGTWDSNTADVGFLISSSTIATNTIVISTGLISAIADGAEVRGWLPTAVEAGVLANGRLGQVTLAGANVTVMNAQVELTNNFSIIENEKNDTEYPTSIIRSATRTVDVTFDQLFRKDTGDAFYKANNQTQESLILPCGSTTAKKYIINVPLLEQNTPTLSGDAEISLGISGVGFASSSYDDEANMMFD